MQNKEPKPLKILNLTKLFEMGILRI